MAMKHVLIVEQKSTPATGESQLPPDGFPVEEQIGLPSWEKSEDVKKLERAWPSVVAVTSEFIEAALDKFPTSMPVTLDEIEVHIGIETGVAFAFVTKTEASITLVFKRRADRDPARKTE